MTPFQVGDIIKPIAVDSWVEVLELIGHNHARCKHVSDGSTYEAVYWIKESQGDALTSAVYKANYQKETHARV